MMRLKEQRQKERHNAYKLDEDAVLSVRVIEARDLRPVGITASCDPYVVLKFGDNQQTQKTKYKKNELSPVWNEVFTFDVQTGTEVLEVSVYDKDDFSTRDEFEGWFEVALDHLKD